MARKKIPYKKITFKWLDAVCDNEWRNIDDITKDSPHEVTTSGYLLFQDKRKTIIATAVSPDDKGNWQASGVFIIPGQWKDEN